MAYLIPNEVQKQLMMVDYIWWMPGCILPCFVTVTV